MNGDHHVIFKSQGGTNNPANLIKLSAEDHYEIHHGTNADRKIEILTKCYDHIRPSIENCWKGKIEDWRIKHIRTGDYNFIFKKMGLI